MRRWGSFIVFAFFIAEGHALTIFTRIDRHDCGDWNLKRTGYAAETGVELDPLVAQPQIAHRTVIDIEDNPPVMDMLFGDFDAR